MKYVCVGLCLLSFVLGRVYTLSVTEDKLIEAEEYAAWAEEHRLEQVHRAERWFYLTRECVGTIMSFELSETEQGVFEQFYRKLPEHTRDSMEK